MKVGILCGGQSAEHEISLLSAKNVLDAIDRSRFEPVIIGIEKSGRWLLEEPRDFLIHPDDPRRVALNPHGVPVTLVPGAGGRLCFLEEHHDDVILDVIFPILHGPFGEDGTVQGLLKLAGVPFAGAGVIGSAVGMDKDVAKRLMRDAGLCVGKFLTVTAAQLPRYDDIVSRLGVPFFVKPANMGSSVGVRKVHSQTEWQDAIREALRYDTKVIIEEAIEGREIECGVLDGDTLTASLPGEVRPVYEFYSYDAKYLDDNGAALEIPAKLSPDTTQRVRDSALTVFRTLCCEGLARVDFFVTAANEIYVNEINTMPGFTRISMYPKLFSVCGIDYTSLITRLIENAVARYNANKDIQTSYQHKEL